MIRTDPSPEIAFTPLGCADEATAIAKAIPKVASAPATTVTILLRLRCLRPFMICSLRAVGLSNSSVRKRLDHASARSDDSMARATRY
jgi:hypothetical protein